MRNFVRTQIRPLFWLLLLLFSASLQAGQAVLWRVEAGNGAVSYLFGTIHSEDPRVLSLPPQVEQTFTASDRVVLEMELTPEVQQKMALAVMLPPQQQLSDLLPDPLYRQTLAAMAERGYAEQITARLQPWAVILTLNMPPPKTGLFLDKVLYGMALAHGKQVGGLETAEEQLAIFRDLSLADQQALLRQALKEYKEMPELMESITGAWLKRDIAALVKMNEESMSDLPQDLRRRFGQRLVEERNHRMAERAAPFFRKGGAFVAVGALHLAGDEGLVALLREKGMKVTPVY